MLKPRGGVKVKIKKGENNPMHKEVHSFMLSPRCGARTRKQGYCLAPAANGKKRCRMHGGAIGSGAPRDNKNALKHGETTREAKAHRRKIRMLIKQCKEEMDNWNFDL